MGLCGRRGLLVLVTWLRVLPAFAAISALIALVKGVPFTPEGIIEMYSGEPYLAAYGEVVGVGGLPLLASLACGDGLEMYGLRKMNMTRSLALSFIVAAIVLSVRTMSGTWTFESFDLTFPYNVWYAALGVAAYGPLEMFFVTWLTVNTDSALRRRGIITPGVLVTSLVFGLMHLALAPQGGLYNAARVAGIFAILGLIFNYTGNPVGPTVAWTLINGQVLNILIGSLT